METLLSDFLDETECKFLSGSWITLKALTCIDDKYKSYKNNFYFLRYNVICTG
jgi:hypothetical protein